MSDEKRALTRHSAPPSEADYEAILAAVVETGRGRWFLHEFAQRNRHAETRGVLSAIERLEGMLQIQGGLAPEAPAYPAARQIAAAIARAREMVGAAESSGKAGSFAGVVQSLEAAQVRIRATGTRLQDTAAALREDGGQTRICNDLDRQIRDLETGCAQLDDAAGDIRILLSLLREIESEIAQPAAAAAATPPRPEPAPEPALVVAPVAVPPAPQNDIAETGILVSDTVSIEELDACIAELDIPEADLAVETTAVAVEISVVDTMPPAMPSAAMPSVAMPSMAMSSVAMSSVAMSSVTMSATAVALQPHSEIAVPHRPLSDPAEFLLEPLPEDDEESPVPDDAFAALRTEPDQPAVKTAAPLQLDSFDPLAPLRLLSDEEKIALFS